MNFLRTLSRATLVASLGALSIPAVGFAQDAGARQAPADGAACHGGRGHHGRRGHGDMFRQLDLTDNQKAQIRAIRESAREQRGEHRGDRAARRAAHQETRALIMDVLTPAQRAQAEQLRAAQATEGMTRRIEHMTERLSLTPAQVTRITRIFEQSQTDRAGLRRMQGEERAAAARALRESTKNAIEAVLTPAQRTQAAEMRENRGRRGQRGEGRGRPSR